MHARYGKSNSTMGCRRDVAKVASRSFWQSVRRTGIQALAKGRKLTSQSDKSVGAPPDALDVP